MSGQRSKAKGRVASVDVRAMTTDRLTGLSTRLLSGGSALLVIGTFMVLRNAWQQFGQSFGPDGTGTPGDVPFAHRASMMVFESSYRPTGVQLLVASALVAAAVAVLHRHPSWEQVRRLRWEVLGAGLLALVVVVGLVLVHVYVMTTPDGADADVANWIGPQPQTALIVGNLMTLCACLLTLTGAMLWWLRLAPVPEDDLEEPDEQEPDEQKPDKHEPDEQEPASDSAPGRASRDTLDSADYSRDWSPEDFRPPARPGST